MSEMKSAWEKALEKAEKLGELSEKELKQFEYVPVGNRLASRYLYETDFNLDAELTKYRGTGVRKYVVQGAQEILVRNIILPQSDRDRQATVRAMAGLRLLKENKSQLELVLDRITNLINYYEQARQQTYLQFRKDFETKLQQANRVAQQQGARVHLEPESHPQFLERWRQISSQLNAQYEKALEEHRQLILKIA